MSKVLISGGTGLVGQHICSLLINKGYEVALLSRSGRKGRRTEIPTYYWDLDKNEIDQEVINTCDHIIHLAGVNIGAKRWTKQRKQQILFSRIKSANLIFNNLNTTDSKLSTFISASAIGYYGSITSDQVFDENDPSADDFLGNICNQWEQSADRFSSSGIRVVKVRTGIVLTNKGGVLSRFITPARFGIGSPIGNGKQFLPWIHIEDLCNLYLRAIENHDMKGPYNAVAPEHITNKIFARKISEIMKKPFWLPNIPAFLIKLVFGEMSAMLLNGSRVSSEKIEATGFRFQFPSIDKTLKSLLKK